MRKGFLLAVLMIVLAGAAGWWWLRVGAPLRRAAQPTTPVFVGESTDLTRTVIVPTLDTPAPLGEKNVIWCATLPMAWQAAESRVVHAPIRLTGADDLAGRLHTAAEVSYGIDPKDAYATAGRGKDGIANTIRTEMTQRFPEVPASWLPSAEDAAGPKDILAYGYLAVQLKFPIPYPQLPAGATFTDSAKAQTEIRAFGLKMSFEGDLTKQREQVAVLYYDIDPDGYPVCAVDLCRTSQPYQLVLACVPPRATLAAMVAEVQQRMQDAAAAPDYSTDFRTDDNLVVPEICWRISHRFRELEGRALANPDFNDSIIRDARQQLAFTLDRSGVQLTSVAKFHGIITPPPPRQLEFTRPFLLYLVKRGATTPFFAMWVDNAELLNK